MACVGPGIARTLLEACVTQASHQEAEEGNNSNVGTWARGQRDTTLTLGTSLLSVHLDSGR